MIGKLEDVATGIILWALFLVVVLQFFTRYVLNDSLGWTEEVARMMLILLTYAGAVVCARGRRHIQVDLLFDYVGDGTRTALVRIYDFIAASLFGFLSWTAIEFAIITRLRLSSIDVPKSLIYWFCAVALALMALHYILHMFSPVDRGRPESGHGPTIDQ